MNEALVRRIKNSLNNQHYTMNDSWLTECIDFYLSDHADATHDEIITFVINQWVLQDLRDINDEKGCLPKDLKNKKYTVLPGKYILQMEMIYDISQSKYKQLEKIRNVSSENVDATEHENAQEDKFQNFEPKSKRMLRLVLTDGVQDVEAIEYKPIRLLKDTLYPGFKVMIKGPVRCRKGVILLEETNFAEVGGEVDSLLIPNAVENIFARALNLEENPDPYNDKSVKTENQTPNTQRTSIMDDDFDLDSQALDQIDKQIQQQTSGVSQNASTSSSKYTSVNTSNISQGQNSSTNKKSPSTITIASKIQQSLPSKSINVNKPLPQKVESKCKERVIDFEDDGDSFVEMVNDEEFKNVPSSKTTFKIPQLPTPLFKNASTLPKATANNNVDIVIDDEIYDLTEDFTLSRVTSKSDSFSIASCNSIGSSTYLKEYQNSTLKSDLNKTSSSSNNNLSTKLCTTSNKFIIPDDDFDLNDINMETDDFQDYFNKSDKNNDSLTKSSQSSTNSSMRKNHNSNEDRFSQKNKNINTSLHSSNKIQSNTGKDSLQKKFSDYNDGCDIEFEAIENRDVEEFFDKNVDNKKFKVAETVSVPSKSNGQIQSDPSEEFKTKRSRDITSPIEETPQKIRCLQNSPKLTKAEERKLIDLFLSPPRVAKNNQSPLLKEGEFNCCELLKNALKQSIGKDPVRIVVRGKVVDIVKLNLLKNEKGPYFYLEGTITDDTANLDVIFSSAVLEKIIGYSVQEFGRKRKQSKEDPILKEHLREVLKKAQLALTQMDELMEIEIKKNEKALILNSLKLTDEQKKSIDDHVNSFKKKKNVS